MRSIQVYHLILAVLIAVLSPAASVASPPALSGKIVEASEHGESPLDQARVELLIPGRDEVKYSAHTDSKGAYAIRGVEPGQYEVVVKSGKRILAQVSEQGEDKRLRKIVVPEEPARLDITVRAHTSS